MKKITLLAALLVLSGNALAAKTVITVSKAQFGGQWAFTKEEVMLQCTKNGALYVINAGTLAQYPLNDLALEQAKSGQVNAQPLDTILLDDKASPGKKMSTEPFVRRAQALCQ
ncbi:YebY family protein [Enterobacillus tribolii]|uniref:Uncharacterized protein DUF2511 n=1 Tax=Enterobacillus tribolii TaxID=1487935 RepID=A0A370R3R1_9GAMM|nr:YebY family protein [Enterobacillus tribolii]MBW7984331.1 DUF2511 domain-containing protein [Enterobacillus tribolii]RDK97068.1 uncharacterized protein DUF2511 [Enterobacillus tribolii]